MASIQVNLNPSESSIEIIKTDGLTSYLKKEGISHVESSEEQNLEFINGLGYRDTLLKVKIYLNNGDVEEFDIQDVSNQPTWTLDTAGLNQAASDIAQTFQPAATPTDPLEVDIIGESGLTNSITDLQNTSGTFGSGERSYSILLELGTAVIDGISFTATTDKSYVFEFGTDNNNTQAGVSYDATSDPLAVIYGSIG